VGWIAISSPYANNRGGHVRAQRIKAAVRDVDNLHHTVDEREADGRQEQPGRVIQPVHENDHYLRHHVLIPGGVVDTALAFEG
ncbi:MAG: hypothetical protein RI904_159, partial [Pseudomonadota bacterium]